MAERKILFICEGEKDEPRFLKALMGKSFPSQRYSIYSYQTNIHILASKLEEEYPDFDINEMDIALILRNLETDAKKKWLLSGSFTDIILAFDFDPHHTDPHFDTVRRMLSYFTESSDMGKLYINYPMMQSYKHFKCLPDYEYFTREVSPIKYKELVDIESCMPNLREYSYDVYMKIAVQNIRKAVWILERCDRVPSVEEYLNFDWVKVYDKELSMFFKNGTVSVLNTLILCMVDYNPTAFFSMLQRHPQKYDGF